MNRAKSFCLMLLLAIAQVAQAETIEGLMAAGELESRAVVKTPAPHFQKAPIEIVVEVGTPHRFSGGVRVRDFTVPGTVVRRTSKFAFNETRRREGESWPFQSWRFALHSERTGLVRIPELTTFISVETEKHGVVKGEVKLTVPPLEIVVPPATEGLDSWVAAEAFKVEESWEGTLDTYEVGDAVTRIRRFTISGSPAMAIPASPEIEFDGVQVYHAPPLVEDKEVGGKLEGVREERVVFTFKGGGSHTIPGDRIHWFNVKTKAVEQVELPGRTLEVSGAAAPDTAAAQEPKGDKINLWPWVLAVLGIALGYWLVRWIAWSSWVRHLLDRLEASRRHRRARTAFMQAAAQQDSRRCLELLYQRMSEHAEWQLSTAFAHDPQRSAVAAALMAHAYADGPPPEVSEVQRLWEVCTTPKKRRQGPSVLRLNPAPTPSDPPLRLNGKEIASSSRGQFSKIGVF